MKRELCLLITSLPLLLLAQGPDTTYGIKWTTGLSWEQVKEKAKIENKYIFLDVFATWCGPCKEMDLRVYPNDSVGRFFNEKFLSVKVQTDKTKKDNNSVKKWYKDAAEIQKLYKIEAYPSFVFLSSEGKILDKASGYRGVKGLIEMAQNVTRPGQIYQDPYAEYDSLVENYQRGVKNYDRMTYMIKTAFKFDTVLAKQLLKEYTEDLSKLESNQRYTKENIEFWSIFLLSSKSKIFQFFYDDQDRIDNVMNEKGYASKKIDETIFNEIVLPFYEEQNKNPYIAMTGMYVGGSGVKADQSEADWKKLEKTIKQRFNESVAKRNVLAARIEWYERHHNTVGKVKYRLLQLKNYPVNIKKGALIINQTAWDAFLTFTDKRILEECITWMQRVVHDVPRNEQYIDTYANLLYKAGRKYEAVNWQQKAFDFAESRENPYAEGFRTELERMKRNEPTYIEERANWTGITWINWQSIRFEKEISVSDINNRPIAGASVKIKRSNETFVANEKGIATPIVSVGNVLVVSYPGYETKEITISKSASTSKIQLQKVK